MANPINVGDLEQLADQEMRNRVHVARARGIPLAEFNTFMPLLCHFCKVETKPAKLKIGSAYDIECIDRKACERLKKEPPPVKKVVKRRVK